MIADACLPPACALPATSAAERRGLAYTAAQWTPGDLERLASALLHSGPSLARIPLNDLLDAWSETVELFRDPLSSQRRALDEALVRCCGLSAAGLSAGLEAVLGGVRRAPATELARQAPEPSPRGLLLIVLASNLPALAVQPLLPALLLRRPVILKSPTAEPLFAPAFVRALRQRLPALAPGLAAITWKGGARALETPLLAAAERIVAYGEEDSIADLSARAAGTVVGYGPKVSLALLGPDVAPSAVAPGIARDVALFDQRGCLSVHAVFAACDPLELASRLAEELGRLARAWPPGPIDPVVAAGVQQVRSEAEMRGLTAHALDLGAGTVVVDPLPGFQPSPGLRTIRIHPIADLDRIPALLAAWDGRLQGVAMAGSGSAALRPRLEALGVSRCTAPGDLQTPDATWHNGGLHPLAALL